MSSFAMRHPDNLFCPICGCEAIIGWPEIFEEWHNWTSGEKKEYEICACCGYGSKDFPYEDFE
jgi:hypothetical protein